MSGPTIKYRNNSGALMEINVDHTVYKEAADLKLTVPDLLMRKCPDADLAFGTPFEQALLHSGLIDRKHRPAGMVAPSMKDIMSDNINMSAIRSPDGTNTAISARMLFPQVILEVMRDYLTEDKSDFINGYNSMVGLTENVTSARVDQPTIDVRANENVSEGQIAQMSEPPALINITVGDTTHRIPTDSIGLLISDEALEATSLDLVNIAMSAHARGKRIRMVENNVKNMVFGDADIGMNALPTVTAQSFDSAITANGQITRRAWLKFLREGYQKCSINSVMMTLDTYFQLEDVLLPKNYSADPRQTSSTNTLANMMVMPQNILLVAPEVIGEGVIVGLDSRYAIRRFVNVSASYEAIENFVLRRAKAFRVDHGEMSRRLYDEAWSVMELTV